MKPLSYHLKDRVQIGMLWELTRRGSYPIAINPIENQIEYILDDLIESTREQIGFYLEDVIHFNYSTWTWK